MPADWSSSLARPPALPLGLATVVPSKPWRTRSRSPIPSPSPPGTGTASTTDASSATPAPGPASSTRASGACASCGAASTTRSCSPATAGRAATASTPSRRSRSTTSCPAPRCSRSARPAATSPAASARTGTSPSRRRSTAWPTPRRPEAIADAARELGCASVAFTYNDPIVFLEYAVDTADGLPRAGRAVRRRLGRLRHRGRPPRALLGASTPPTSTSRASPTTSTGTWPWATLAPGARHPRATSATRPTPGSRSRPC